MRATHDLIAADTRNHGRAAAYVQVITHVIIPDLIERYPRCSLQANSLRNVKVWVHSDTEIRLSVCGFGRWAPMTELLTVIIDHAFNALAGSPVDMDLGQGWISNAESPRYTRFTWGNVTDVDIAAGRLA